MPQYTGLFRVTPYEDITCSESLEGEVVRAFFDFLHVGHDVEVWLDHNTCAKDDPPQGFLDQLQDARHYHFIVTFYDGNELTAATAAASIINEQQWNSFSMEPVQNYNKLTHWLEQATDMEKIDIEEVMDSM